MTSVIHTKRICVVIPAYNEERSIPWVVTKVLSLQCNPTCIVVDDGSTDTTAFQAKNAGARVIRLQTNRGTGWAAKIGLVWAFNKSMQRLIFLDADRQHDPKYIPRLLAELDNGADYVIGSRYVATTTPSTSWMRRIGTRLISLMFTARYGRYIADPTSGYRAMNRKTLQILTRNGYPSVFPVTETLQILLQKKLVVREISVPISPRKHGSSSISPSRAIYLFMYTAKKLLLGT